MHLLELVCEVARKTETTEHQKQRFGQKEKQYFGSGTSKNFNRFLTKHWIVKKKNTEQIWAFFLPKIKKKIINKIELKKFVLSNNLW